ncbi:MAG TPA: glutamine--fructose-6-phosphate transaminase (isomerizing) [Candidatus Coatesbacteria bacterium]|nr:glutamine--fructose-6-phosphate transaminase (isomerizing) [Candidatus Coatesbacteria bacterium]
MCGIVGYVGNKVAQSVLLVGLEKLEYRGYDSAGIATIHRGELGVRKKEGKLRQLAELLASAPLGGTIGIGHTRWATHGEPSDKNAHPHTDGDDRLAIVHNGVIENYLQLREELETAGHVFKSETDSEVVAHLLADYISDGLSPQRALLATFSRLDGYFALAVVSESFPDRIYAVRQGPPLVIGLGEGENFLASDTNALLRFTRRVVFVEDGQVVELGRDTVSVIDREGQPVGLAVREIKLDAQELDKGDYAHYMLKEIFEQPRLLGDIFLSRVTNHRDIAFANMGLSPQELNSVSRVVIQAAGTSWHAGLVGKYLLEHYVRLHVEVDVSSEFRYRNPVLGGDTIVMAISQSGETADTLAGIREAKSKFIKVISLVNVEGSTIDRESDGVIHLMAGPEIGVASTKAFTAQLIALVLLAMHWGRLKYAIDDDAVRKVLRELEQIPEKMERILAQNDSLRRLAGEFADAKDFFFIGRGYNYPTALEGALKLKEISYIHATGYPAGELKHGPIALIESDTPVVAVCNAGPTYQKTMSNVAEVRARGGRIIIVATEGDAEAEKLADHVIYIPPVIDELSPLLTVVPLQLLAYHVAVLRGCDVDRPRNLAKSVTVE